MFLGTWLDLLPRVASRTPPELLDQELGRDPAEEVRARYRTTAALAVQAEGLCRQLAETASKAEIPVFFLKGMALHLLGVVEFGARGSCDVDVLVPVAQAEELQGLLLESGYRDMGMPASQHQLPPIVHPAGLVLEVHTMLWGVRLSGAGGSATAESLIDAGRIHTVTKADDVARVPDREVLLCHALVHGIAQHGLSPMAYLMTRMLADVQDFKLSPRDWQDFAAGPQQWIATDVSQDEVEAVASLVMRLDDGEDPGLIAADESGASRLLRHVVYGVLDHDYREALRLKALSSPHVEQSLLGAFAKAAVKAVWLTDAQIDTVYGKPASRAGYWGRRVLRPFDLVLRALRYAWAWASYRIRKRN
jgi:hypothetical protein